MINKLAIAAGLTAAQVMAAHAAATPEQELRGAGFGSVQWFPGFNDECHPNDYPEEGFNYPCNEAAKFQSLCEQMTDLKEQQQCMCNYWFWDNMEGCDECKVYHAKDGVESKKHWAGVYQKVRENYCGGAATNTFSEAWRMFASEAPSFNAKNYVQPAPPKDKTVSLYWTPKSKQPEYDALCAFCSFTTSVKIELPSRVSVINVATVSPSAAQHVASPVSSVMTVSTSAPFPINNTNSNTNAIVPAHVVYRVIDFRLLCETLLCKTCVPKYFGGDVRVVPNQYIESKDVATTEKQTGATTPDALWCGCVPNQVLPGTKVIVDDRICFASFDHVNQCVGNNVPAGSKPADNVAGANSEPVHSRKPLPGAGPSTGAHSVSFPVPFVCPPFLGKECKPSAGSALRQGVVSSKVSGADVYIAYDRLPAAQALFSPINYAPKIGGNGSAGSQAQNDAAPQQGSQGHTGAVTTGGAPSPAGSSTPANAGVGCLRASAVLAAVAAVAAAL